VHGHLPESSGKPEGGSRGAHVSGRKLRPGDHAALQHRPVDVGAGWHADAFRWNGSGAERCAGSRGAADSDV
jgi:hypothetical protein